MTLYVFTSHYSTTDPDRLDVTRGSGSGDDLAFAPSSELLKSYKFDLRQWSWSTYAVRYVEEMHESRVLSPKAWSNLLARERVVLVCFCHDATRCHRSLLARELGNLGARVVGEVAPVYRSDD